MLGYLAANFLVGRQIPPPVAPPSTPPVTTPTPPQEPRLAESIARNLEIPWELAFLPDGGIVLTERPGRVRLIDTVGNLQPQPLLTLPEVAAVGEGGLLGLALHPDFAANGWVYLYHTYESEGSLFNRIVRFAFADNSLIDHTVILEDIPGASIHNGGRIRFGPDGLLYATTGDAAVANLSQDPDSLAGKILRIKDDGSIPPENPFPDSPVYSYGHRNPQGLAWDEHGRLWSTEHGATATDEVNLILPGRNYGWPVIRGDAEQEGMESPYIQSGRETWAPAGAAIVGDSLFFTGLRGQTLYELPLETRPPALDRHLVQAFGRLRAVVSGPDGFLYILTNNSDGRGIPLPGDDHVIRINPALL